MITEGNILIIDDDPLLLMNYADLLIDNGYNVTEANSYTQGKNYSSTQSFDIIICDHDLGDGKGIELIKTWIKTNYISPVIFLTGADAQIIKEANELPNVVAALPKPISEEKILELVKDNIKTNANDKYPKLIEDDERDELLSCFNILTEMDNE
jgi:DNA-binding NtrC family response regulator